MNSFKHNSTVSDADGGPVAMIGQEGPAVYPKVQIYRATQLHTNSGMFLWLCEFKSLFNE